MDRNIGKQQINELKDVITILQQIDSQLFFDEIGSITKKISAIENSFIDKKEEEAIQQLKDLPLKIDSLSVRDYQVFLFGINHSPKTQMAAIDKWGIGVIKFIENPCREAKKAYLLGQI